MGVNVLGSPLRLAGMGEGMGTPQNSRSLCGGEEETINSIFVFLTRRLFKKNIDFKEEYFFANFFVLKVHF